MKINKETEMKRHFITDGFGNKYSYKTLKTDCKWCNDFFSHKCNWEERTRAAIAIEYKEDFCESCRKVFDIVKE